MSGPGWSVEVRWEEELWYHEGDDAFCFECGWAESPYVCLVPSERLWDQVVPAWLRGRRDEILTRLREANDQHGHVLVDTEVGYQRRPKRDRR